MEAGGCYCGAVRYEITGDTINHSLCHCSDCRKSAGASPVAWLMGQADQVTITRGKLKKVKGREGAVRSFCGDCGTGILYENAINLPGLVDVQSATLDNPHAIPVDANIQLADQVEWQKTAHRLPGFDRYPPQE